MKPVASHAVVLLSGGMDSVVCLHWSLRAYGHVRAIGFDYGQPNRDAELTVAQRIAERNDVCSVRVCLADALRAERGRGLMAGVVDHGEGPDGGAEHPAFVPGRNALFLVTAAAHAACWWSYVAIDLVIGANEDDAAGFPDCRPEALDLLAYAISLSCARSFRIVAPFAEKTKREIAGGLSPADIEDVCSSWSCYRGDGPCGRCTPCVLRRDAFAAAGLVDACAPVRLHGGDPARERT